MRAELAQEISKSIKQEWLSSLGEAVVSPAIPFKDTHTVYPDDTAEPGTTTVMSGMSILRFDSMGAALEAAKACPFLEIKGTLEVSEMLEMSVVVKEHVAFF